ncbi:hypothetical protein A0H81_12185 [Grifola frondosa]|uniref:RRM domain-containing protein n=1 Tax=Grifola frondosa TaxID=5627 RepID=A0A1C7LSG4_GRIFR|nr:hypothetical protein A0H81_12185 [Grifola frondosa]
MDVKAGKGFVEFASAAQADAAYNSPRLPGGEGREHIRVWWFRRDNAGGAKEMEEGELEEGELPETEPPVGTKLWWKKQKAQKTHRRKKGLELADRLSGASAPVHMREGRRPPNETWPAYSRVEAQDFSHGVMDAPRPPLLSRFSLPEHGWSYNESDEHISEDLFSTALPDSPPLMEDLLVGAGDEEAMELESDDGRDMAFVGLLESPNWIDDEQSIASSRPGSPVAQPTAIETEQVSLPATSVVEVTAVAHSLAVDLEHEPVAPTKATPVEEPSSASVTSSSGATSSFCFTSSFGVAPSCGATEATPEALLTCDSSRSPSPPLLPCSPPDSPSATGMPPYYSPSSPFYTRSPSCEPSTNTREAILARRQLLARRKALEDAIAKTKLQLANKLRNASESSSSSEPTTPPSDAIGSGLVTGTGKNADRTMFEDSLRRAVLESRPKVSSPSRPFSVTTPSSMDDMDIDMTAPASPRRVAGSTTIIRTSNNLEELAVSFITETIRTVKPPPAKPAQTEKMRLLAKQKRLEQHIAESKMLMAKLTAARTKEEKGAILGVLRERRRVMDEEAKAEAVAHEISPPAYSVQTVAQKFRTRWPETQPEATIIIISDDEDDD